MEDAQPFFASGNYAPIATEHDVTDLPIRGEIPHGLRGTLFRNGPNPQSAAPDPAAHHWFLGDGMVHGFTLGEGRASWRNRWVRTDKFLAERAAGRALSIGFGGARETGIPDTGLANTSLVHHAGRLLALEEAHLPWALDPATLETRGVEDFGGQIRRFTAHPKADPATGELVFFGYSTAGPLSAEMAWGTLSPAGAVTRHERFPVPFCAMVHDFAVTERHVLFPLMPLTGSLPRAMRGGPAFAWEPELGGHVGLLRRADGVASLRWFRAEACYAFHVLNAWEDAAGRVLADVMESRRPAALPPCRWQPEPEGGDPGPPDPLGAGPGGGHGCLPARAAGRPARRVPPDGRPPRRPAQPPRRLYGPVARRGARHPRLVRPGDRGRRHFTVPAGDALSEAVFVPRSAAAEEGDGWLMTVAWRATEGRSELLVLDSQDVAAGPVATVALPGRVPHGFHGTWVPADG
ncbi:carotenoid oxygenase family protein [Dankookia sp. P2]|uniref:carotenoid oxygenase family protein n=1 Tax=Dankookia sp. P2 TaxID=3423955 RepID=UPI003D67958D